MCVRCGTGSIAWCTSPDNHASQERTPRERYWDQSKARLAERAGEDLAEEFFSVAFSAGGDVVTVAELMYAAYLMGKRAGNGA